MAVSFRQATLHGGGTNWPIMCPPTVKVRPLCQPRITRKQVCGLILFRCKVRTAQESSNRHLRDRCGYELDNSYQRYLVMGVNGHFVAKTVMGTLEKVPEYLDIRMCAGCFGEEPYQGTGAI